MIKELPKLACIPEYTTTLPSGKTIKYRPFLVKEEKMLLLSAESGDDGNRIISQIIEACTFGAMKGKKMSLSDMEWMLIHLKIVSKGGESKLGLTCSNEVDGEVCDQYTEFSINVKDYTFDDDNIDRVIKLSDTDGLKIKDLSVEDVLRIEQLDSEIEQKFEKLYSSIEMFYFGDDVFLSKDCSREAIESYFDSLTHAQLELIIQRIESLPKIMLNIPFVCPKCGHKEDLKIEGIDYFLD